ncbi:DUF302 domain-containing protein [Streptomyces gibsoniae]|uniref:DUF302 domain-containing protein n=1 Tax=Streptomyces gibsoniae TaxID=3075529 RepID=A0ABU2U6J9_9ACTN|nr:DUF302 domain-containing protein [Streptomyces sp. DSM 41699]MDT0468836.1 hypothetical protein [Streptomyces sp. DSM 41699]
MARQQSHTVTRIEIPTGIAYDDFVAAFEKAAPAFDPSPMERIAETGGSWDSVRAATAVNAPNDLMRYARINGTQLLRVAGHSTRSMEYLTGNHVIAETMFRHDPRVLLYAPLRMLIHSDVDGNAVFSMHRPSDEFASLGIPEVTEVGKDLDRIVVDLLRVCGVDAADAFTTTGHEAKPNPS